jgi:hypothetical protein
MTLSGRWSGELAVIAYKMQIDLFVDDDDNNNNNSLYG